MIVFNNRFVDPLFVVIVRRSFDFNFKVWILWKEDSVQEFCAKGETACCIQDHVDEITFGLVDDIMIANDLISFLLFGDTVAPAGNAITN